MDETQKTKVTFVKLADERAMERFLLKTIRLTYAAGERQLLWGDDKAAMGALDNLLWEAEPESFLPHDLSDGDSAGSSAIIADPIVLSCRAMPPQGSFETAYFLGSVPCERSLLFRAVYECIRTWRDDDVARQRQRYKAYRELPVELQVVENPT